MRPIDGKIGSGELDLLSVKMSGRVKLAICASEGR
jgi:hypothetical protein